MRHSAFWRHGFALSKNACSHSASKWLLPLRGKVSIAPRFILQCVQDADLGTTLELITEMSCNYASADRLVPASLPEHVALCSGSSSVLGWWCCLVLVWYQCNHNVQNLYYFSGMGPTWLLSLLFFQPLQGTIRLSVLAEFLEAVSAHYN